MKKLRYICLLWSVLLVFCACCRKESLIPKKVMVLHSYHKGMNYWQQELLRGLDEGFRNQRVAVKTEHFYLDFEQQQTVIHMQREIKKIFDGHPVFYSLI